ncbi:hypothetical protein TNCV_1390241 [Trichonephila clavipes]|nr:hypothetical protein TNCV_1390241 [Trichonephila clavipes]
MSPGRCNTGLTTPKHAEYQSDPGEYYTTHQAMPSEVPVDMRDGVVGQQVIGQAYPTHALLDSSPVSMLAHPYGRYPPIEGIRLPCLHGEDGRCHPKIKIQHTWRPETNVHVVPE